MNRFYDARVKSQRAQLREIEESSNPRYRADELIKCPVCRKLSDTCVYNGALAYRHRKRFKETTFCVVKGDT